MILWLMAMLFVLTHSQWKANPDVEEDDESSRVSGTNVLRMPRVQLSILMMMGGAIVECLASLWIASLLVQRFDLTESTGAIGLGVYWIGLTGARMLVPVFWPKATSIRLQRWSTVLVVAASVLLVFESLATTWLGIALVGLGIASIFPVAMTITAERFGPAVSAHAVGYLISGSTFMFAIMPPISGWLADRMGFVVVPCLMLAGSALLLGTQWILVRGDTPATADRLD